MELQQINLYNEPLDKILKLVKTEFSDSVYSYKKHQVEIINNDTKKVGTIRLPLSTVITSELTIDNTINTTLYLTIEAGNAAVCVQQGDENVYHTTFSAYMTRKKQGFSQIKYLKKKGKSRAGSRVRLAKTILFFESINLKLQDLFETYSFDRIAMQCSPTLIPYLHNSKELCPFTKSDKRLYKIPLHIQQSNYTCLYGVIKKLMPPILFYDSDDLKEIAVLGNV